MAGSVVLTIACIAPIVLWGDPYPDEVVHYWLWGTVACSMIALGFAALPATRRVPERLVALINRPSPGMFAAIAAAAAAVLGATLATYVFARTASTPDEIAQLWHAKILLHGHLSLPVDPNPEFFSLETVVDVGRWYSQFPIGGPLALLPGALLGAPWLVNPVLLGFTAAALYHFARRAFGETQGRFMTAAVITSPMILLMAGTWMNHVPVLCLTAIALAALVEWEVSVSRRRAAAFAACVGLACGAIATIRPLDAVVVTAVIGVFQLFVIGRDWPRLRDLAIEGAAAAAAAAPLLWANALTTGAPLRFGYDVLWGAGHRVGFHADPHGSVHTLGRGLEYAVTYIGELNVYLMAWPVPAIVIAIVGLVMMRRTTRWDALMIALFLAQVLAYSAYWGEGEFLGPRFLYTALPALVIVLVRVGFGIGERFGEFWTRAAVGFFFVCVTAAWTLPGMPYNARGLALQARGTRSLLRIDVASAVKAANVHRALVFLREPFSQQLARRLWGVGFLRSDAARLISESDACSLLTAVRAAESDTVQASAKMREVVRIAKPFVQGDDNPLPSDPTIHVSSAKTLTPECRDALEQDSRIASAPFGPALPLEPIDSQGRVDGDVIYVADLGDHNQVLRARFGDRPWYRVIVVRGTDLQLHPTVARY